MFKVYSLIQGYWSLWVPGRHTFEPKIRKPFNLCREHVAQRNRPQRLLTIPSPGTHRISSMTFTATTATTTTITTSTTTVMAGTTPSINGTFRGTFWYGNIIIKDPEGILQTTNSYKVQIE